jgi:hypothetical protein
MDKGVRSKKEKVCYEKLNRASASDLNEGRNRLYGSESD